MSCLALFTAYITFMIGLALIGMWILVDDNPRILIAGGFIILLAVVSTLALVVINGKKGEE